jgi:DNA repair and recombination protein RAD54B
VFLQLSDSRIQEYNNELESECDPLAMINHLKKTCNSPTFSKFGYLKNLLAKIINKGDKVVIVCHSTAALDDIEKELCYSFARLDGRTPSKERMQIVDTFNRNAEPKAFLLSAKAGGVGLNLIGANHLILFDIDWNPAIETQAMARIWRDGQTKPVFIYRLIT